MFCSAACRGSDPTKDSVRVNFSDVQATAEAERLQAEQDAERLAREEEERAREEAEREAEQRAEEERLQREAEEEAERRRLEEHRAREEEEARLVEKARQEAEEQARLERQRREEQQRQAQLKEARERKEALDTFCRKHGFVDIRTPRRAGCTLWSATTAYPLHLAAELADTRIVEMLLKEGVDVAVKNSAGKTAAQVAQKKNKSGSHLPVQSLLGGAPRPRSGGA